MLIPLSYIKLEETLVPRHNTNGTLLQDWELKSSMKEFCLILRGIIFAYLVCVAQNVTNASCLFFHKVQWTIRGSASSAQWVCSNSIKRRILAVGRHIFETIVVTMEPSWNAVVVKSCRGIIFAYLVCTVQNVTNESCLFFTKFNGPFAGQNSIQTLDSNHREEILFLAESLRPCVSWE